MWSSEDTQSELTTESQVVSWGIFDAQQLEEMIKEGSLSEGDTR